MTELWKMSSEELLEGFECECGKKHFSGLKVGLDRDIIEECGSLVQNTGRVLLLDSFQAPTDYVDELHEKLEKHGYIIQRFAPTSDDASGVELVEGTILILAIGGERIIERAKLLALSFNIPLIVLPTTLNLVRVKEGNSVLDYGGVRILRPSHKPDKILLYSEIFQKMDVDIFASVYAELYSKTIALCDYVYKGCVKGEFCYYLSRAVLKLYRKINGLGIPKTQEGFRVFLEQAVKLNALLSCENIEEGGEGQLATTLERYTGDRERKKLPRGEVLFLSSVIVGKVYSKFLERELPYGVHDLYGDWQKMESLMSVGDKELANFVYDDNYKYRDYKMKLTKDEVLSVCREVDDILQSATGVVKRIFRDGGFHLRYYLTAQEMLFLLPLSPVYLVGETLLGFIKERGLLNIAKNI